MRKVERLVLVLAFWLLLFASGGSDKALAVGAAINKYRASQYRELGLSYQQQERYSLAIRAMKKSVELDPENIVGRVNLGWAQHLAGQDNAAAESLVQAIYRDPVSVPALNALGIVYLVSNNLAAAVVVHNWAAALQPDDEVAYYNLSLAFERLQLYSSAIATAKRAATLEPHNPHPLVALAISHWEQGDRTLAKLAYRKANALDSRYSDHSFLPQLKKAGFSQSQIQLADQVRSASKL
ncbi:MAG: tetratricopeptide repeat protein [Chroococcidiopsidaceae cyanobacterium CP_BM_RX_35]|nr:tetratricopeptide repeat protein [Chroococcidiopsidaceae cyanobacterium CP_BM_RX_35]